MAFTNNYSFSYFWRINSIKSGISIGTLYIYNILVTKILGISAFYHDSAAAIIHDGKIIAAAQEERFSRKKHDNSFPKKSINYVLGNSNINLRDVHQIAYSWGKGFDKNLISLYEERAQQLKKNKKGLKIFNERIKHEKITFYF